ncbi:hypothetical protein N7481_000364 [Penicillium waksmanii]|uniref:uncharacterized protein n=1 Tax=Penicillium waksmanii TaxID=69791 RepID=UPI002547CE65|nr:uncharacterized protein N7481_000364 [Penicillium waksmanii]KAJ5999955.1 hypothetical protein N7481_000364 [Penicillium waksmanii]
MTRWVNLGPGFDSEDPLWKIHVYGRPVCRPERLDDLVASPRLYFEEQAPDWFEELRDRNLSYLKDEQYKKDGLFEEYPFEYPLNPSTWHISYKEPSKL